MLPSHHALDVICSKKLCLEGFLTLCGHLSGNTSITSLRLRKFPNEYITYFQDSWKALRELLVKNAGIEELTIIGRGHVFAVDDHPGENDNNFFRTFVDGLQRNDTIKSLVLEEMDIPNSRAFTSIFSEAVSIQSLELTKVGIAFSAWLSLLETKWRPSYHLTSLKLEGRIIESKSFLGGLFHVLSVLPSLRHLKLSLQFHSGVDSDVTPHLENLLEENRLKALDVSDMGGYVNWSHICTACLKSNTSLERLVMPPLQPDEKARFDVVLLETLQEHNAVLYWVNTTNKNNEEIFYWLFLNKMGRASVRDSATSKTDFVNLLCQIPCRNRSVKVCFGLLREVPAKWSNS